MVLIIFTQEAEAAEHGLVVLQPVLEVVVSEEVEDRAQIQEITEPQTEAQEAEAADKTEREDQAAQE
jgi:hypothetical protein